MFNSFYHSTDQNMGVGIFSGSRFARRGDSLISQQGAGVEGLQNEKEGEVSVILFLYYAQLQTDFQSVLLGDTQSVISANKGKYTK